jgi:hypothetical protein
MSDTHISGGIYLGLEASTTEWATHLTPYGTDTATRLYEFHTWFYLHNLSMDGLSTIQGNNSSGRWANAYPSGIYQTPLAGRQYNPGVTPFQAGYMTRKFDGNTGGGIYVPGWTEDLGFTVAWPGHETHTGGSGPIIVPKGDLEWRLVYRATRSSHVPRNTTAANLFTSSSFVNIDGVFTLVIDRDIKVEMHRETGVWSPQPTDTASIPWGIYRTTVPTTNFGPPSEQPGTPIVTGNLKASDGEVNLGVIDCGPDWPDIIYVIGESAGASDPTSFGQWYCNLDPLQVTYATGLRWPADPQPFIGFLFCPFHLGLLFLDNEKVGYIPVQEVLESSVQGVEVTFPVAPGWGWTKNNRYFWVPYSAAQLSGDDSHDYTLMSGTIAGQGGFLRLAIPPPSIEQDYDFSQSSVEVDSDDPSQHTTSPDWVFEMTCYFENGAGVGDYDYGPALYFQMGWGNIELYTGPNGASFGGVMGGFGDGTGPVDVDYYQPFHLRLIASRWGWAIKMWQDGQAVPSGYIDYSYFGGSFPDLNTGAYPFLNLWQDRGRAPFAAPYGDVDLYFWVTNFEIAPTTTELTWVDPGQPPIGGDVDFTIGEGGTLAVGGMLQGSVQVDEGAN